MKLPEELETPLRNFLEALSEAKPEDLIPFDGTFRVKETPIVIKVKPKTTMGELEHFIEKSVELAKRKEEWPKDKELVIGNISDEPCIDSMQG